jgi:type II secretory ATPase GspE/PulE/Tfp pilus assembly ATPase PilB-like protein
VHAALTGHIVLSTLHTNNAMGVIPRLIDMEVPPFLLSTALNLMAAQRLVSRLCQNCRKPKEAPAAVAEIIKRELAKLPESVTRAYKEPYNIFHAAGCQACKGKGVTGRTAIFEVFQMTPELADLIVAPDFSEGKLVIEAKRQKMISLRGDGILKALDGLVGIEEVVRETEEV